ncbi:MAG: class I SAM-dependent methyltransferase [Gammaproteobacteria bacterium]|jgi:ubiquinone/menaquinone biosynthesis C-methylase UbiE|nr:class I SAM-dependent methyltransferase [Alphaproteobacteria bacterium]MBT4494945.1 class I SAM-dependent methyltransferase [Gammaproteobacteria bacterium]MBT7370261.1 class I SAM-dependent methyltransferase [Gammaproteobacteria bacterium]
MHYNETVKTHYDTIGKSYSSTRQPDPRIAKQILSALGSATSVANIGAGTGSYEPEDRQVIAVEPSATMISQRQDNKSCLIQGSAEKLPLANQSVDAALAILTIHHWTDLAAGIQEMHRVARNEVVILSWDQAVWESNFWMIRDYHQQALEADRHRAIPIEQLCSYFKSSDVSVVPIPHDCMDGFHGAFWQRPEAYLDPVVRAGISTYANMSNQQELDIVGRLQADLEDGSWRLRNAHLLQLEEIDLGYRLIVGQNQ